MSLLLKTLKKRVLAAGQTFDTWTLVEACLVDNYTRVQRTSMIGSRGGLRVDSIRNTNGRYVGATVCARRTCAWVKPLNIPIYYLWFVSHSDIRRANEFVTLSVQLSLRLLYSLAR